MSLTASTSSTGSRTQLTRSAYELGDVEASKQAHKTQPVEKHKKGGEFVKGIVYGGLDGIVTSFAVRDQ